MKKIKFKVGAPKENTNIVSLIMEIDKISCRFSIDMNDGIVFAENLCDSIIKEVIDLVDKYYTILNIDIDNTFEALPIENTCDEMVCKKQPEIAKPQSENDLIVNKREYENNYVEERFNKLHEKVSLVLYKQYATEKEVADYINTCLSEISMRYFAKPSGDFTDCLKEIATETSKEMIEDISKVEKDVFEVVKQDTYSQKLGSAEVALQKEIGFALDKLDASKELEERIMSFLGDIGMPTNKKMVTQAFIVACNVKKINFENVLKGLHEEFPNENEKNIQQILKDTFRDWLEVYPILKECYNISIMSLLKVFAKRVQSVSK